MRIKPTSIYAIVTAAALTLSAGCSGDPGTPVDVVIQLPGPAQTLSKAVIEVDYARAGAVPAGGRKPSCTALLPYLDATFSDDGRSRLIIDVSSPQGFTAPADLVACRMLASKGNEDAARIQARLSVRVDSALDMSGQPVGDKRLAGLSSRIQMRADRSASKSGDEARATQQRDGDNDSSGQAAAVRPASPVPGGTRSSQPQAGFPTTPGSRPAGRIASAVPGGGAGAVEERSPPPGSPRVVAPNTGAGASAGSGGSSTGLLDDGPSAADSGLGREGAETPPGVVRDVGPTFSYEITVSVLSNSGELGALQVDVGNTDGGGFVGNGSSVDCTSLLGGALVAFNNRNGTLRAGFIAHTGFATPAPVASCRFKSRSNVVAESFTVEVTDASDTESDQVEPPPFAAVSDVRLLR